MAILDLFSKRRRHDIGQVPDVYQYDSVPEPLRIQLIQIFDEAFSHPEIFKSLVLALCREYGRFNLAEVQGRHGERLWNQEFFHFILQTKKVEEVLDATELALEAILSLGDQYRLADGLRGDSPQRAKEIVEEVNHRFREHGFGYLFESDRILRIDDEYVHHETVKPALRLLNDKKYPGAQEEFLKAHEHYRNGRMAEALNEALKAFESTLKVIAQKRKWTIKDRPTAKNLLDAAFENELVPEFWRGHFAGIRSTLESGVPTARNRLSGHGQGNDPQEVPEHIAAYVLHSTAAAIVLFVQSDKASP